MSDDPKHLRILDSTTGAELASLGMVMQRKAQACSDCRFQEDRRNLAQGLALQDYCTAYNAWCSVKNTDAQCELWDPHAKALARMGDPQQITNRHALAASYVAVVLSVFAVLVSLFGRCTMIQKVRIEINDHRSQVDVVVDDRVVATVGLNVDDKLYFEHTGLTEDLSKRIDILSSEAPAAQYVCEATARWICEEYARWLRHVLVTGRLVPNDNPRGHLLDVMRMQCAEFGGHGAAFVELLAHFLETAPAPKWDETSMKVVADGKTFDEADLAAMNLRYDQGDP